MWNRLRSLIAAPQFEGDEEKTRTARILNAVIGFNLAIWILTLPVLPFLPRPELGFSTVLSLILIGFIALVVLHTGRIQLIARGFVFFLWLAVSILIALTGSVVNPETTGFVIVILAAGLLAGTRTAIIYGGLSIISVLLIYFLETRDLLPVLLRTTPEVGLMIIVINILVTSGLLFVALNHLWQALGHARQNAQALDQERATLEERVAERTQGAELARQEAEEARAALETQLWQVREQSRLNYVMRGEQDTSTLATNVLDTLCKTLNTAAGVIFLRQEDSYVLVSSYAYNRRKSPTSKFKHGEGLPGQAALEKQMLILEPVPYGYMNIRHASMELVPQQIVAIPFLFDEKVVGVIELAALEPFTESQIEFIQRNIENIGVAFGTTQAREQVDRLLIQTRQQARALLDREEALQHANFELNRQAEDLRISQHRLQENQANLEAANTELEEKTETLQRQRALLDQQNRELRTAQVELNIKADELAQANRYKSEFLANMSHELRTPLNSMLILAGILAKNEAGNLTEDQLKSAEIIHKSGIDLLNLINDILDLSKVEAGRMEFYFQPMSLTDLVTSMQIQFNPVAEEQNLSFVTSLADDLPDFIETDSQRLEQVIKNLLSNAFKFTSEGSVTLSISRPEVSKELERLGLRPEEAIAIQVKDTGIGILPEKQAIIFEAFQQAEGSTSRRYGGTGLGLAIVHEMIIHLGGIVLVESQPGQGSAFTVLHPLKQKSLTYAQPYIPPPFPKTQPVTSKQFSEEEDSNALPKMTKGDHPLQPSGEPLLLIIENDPQFATNLEEFAHKKGFHSMVAETGEVGLEMTFSLMPQAILLDLNLPGISGWDVLQTLKQNPSLRHIPVHIVSDENESTKAFQMGVIGFMTKPGSPEDIDGAFQEIQSFISREVKSLLIVEDDENLRTSLVELLSGTNIEITEARWGKSALEFLRDQKFDCMILDLNLPDMTGFDLLKHLNQDSQITKCPVIVYTGRELTEEENHQLMRFADSVIIKGTKSLERLLDETALFLHQVIADLPAPKQQTIQKLYRQETALLGKKILIVDDDMRNSFALSKLLNEKGLKVEIASNGKKALDILEKITDIDLVLMDIMMPVMDGLEATRQIRRTPNGEHLPILAITAKAMKGDREKCLEAGANDYLSKPIDPERLFTMLRVWLYDR